MTRTDPEPYLAERTVAAVSEVRHLRAKRNAGQRIAEAQARGEVARPGASVKGLPNVGGDDIRGVTPAAVGRQPRRVQRMEEARRRVDRHGSVRGRAMTARPVHVVPFAAIGGRPHVEERCWCGPIAVGASITDPAVVIFRHRPPVVDRPSTPRQRAAARDFAAFGLDAPWVVRDEDDR